MLSSMSPRRHLQSCQAPSAGLQAFHSLLMQGQSLRMVPWYMHHPLGRRSSDGGRLALRRIADLSAGQGWIAPVPDNRWSTLAKIVPNLDDESERDGTGELPLQRYPRSMMLTVFLAGA